MLQHHPSQQHERGKSAEERQAKCRPRAARWRASTRLIDRRRIGVPKCAPTVIGELKAARSPPGWMARGGTGGTEPPGRRGMAAMHKATTAGLTKHYRMAAAEGLYCGAA